jgi:hypothetical protein
VFVVAMGCGGPHTTPGPDPRWILQDIPAPAGFKYVVDQSNERKLADGRRVIRHMYEVKGGVQENADFYRNEMPHNGWVLAEETLQGGRQRFLFDKGNESCHISIYDDWGTKVLIQILPKGTRPTDVKPAVTPTSAPKTRPTTK